MKDAEILAHFDGRGRAEFLLGGFEGRHSDKITAIAYELGYDLQATEMPSKSTIRLIFVRNDSPTARQRAQQTHGRLRAGGPLLQVWAAPAAQPGATTPVTAIDMASKRRGLAAYEANGVKGFAVFVALLSLGCFIVAWVQRDTPGTALAMVMLGIPLAVTAALIPRWTKRWYEKNRRLVDLYDQQRAGQVGPPPPPPAPGPTDQRPGEWDGQ
ncbi:hypothetical protein [Streptomyces albicerus]|uniref:hypothetical protein n=1 Tax=Streptomyces albicerus TaxID=2569859 RepID=UPI00124AFBFB|nr:hypothetical protein [Streptomyces albicerus]